MSNEIPEEEMIDVEDTASSEVTEDRIYEVVVAMDFSDLSDRALEQAIALTTHHPHSRLHVISVGRETKDAVRLPGGESSTTHAAEDVKAHVMRQIERYRNEHGPFALDRVVVIVAVGDPATRILAFAETVDADVIVMGTRGRQGVERLLSGSVAERIVREAQCGVYVVHGKTRKPPERSIPPPAP